MKIERISENQIKCTLNRSDLASRQIRMSELAYGTEKTRGLFQDMMEQASNEVGFDASDLPLMIEAIPVSMDCIVLMITKVEDPEEMDTRFSSLTHISELLSEPGNKQEDPESDFAPLPSAPVQSGADMERLFSFDSLDTVVDFAHHMNGLYNGKNSLYKSTATGRFYLLLSRSSHSLKEFGMICNCALEYGRRESVNYASSAYLEEHFEKILSGKALQSLAYV